MSDDTETVEGVAGAQDAQDAQDAKPSDRISMDNMRLLENIDVVLTVEVGNAEIKIRDLLR